MMVETFDAPKKRRRGRLLRYLLFTPFRIGWWMASRVEKSTGIIFTLIMGAALLAGGIFLSSTLLGLILGVPMIVAGGFLVLRALY
jgi:hypothetical protein